MFWIRWIPWKFMVRRLARAHGFLDPVALLATLRHFSQPSEVDEPIELLRAGAVFHARGLLNNRVVQNNLDWVWPYWIERQFDPRSESFLPRAFSITHVNLTHRNWTAVGLPDCPELPIVDPRGLLTPLYDGWSLDTWVVSDEGASLFPSRTDEARQRLILDDGVAVETSVEGHGLSLTSLVDVSEGGGEPLCRLKVTARAQDDAWAVVALRPCNPEGINLVHKVALSPDRTSWTVDGQSGVFFDRPPDEHRFSHYGMGDLPLLPRADAVGKGVTCDVGMATAGAFFRLEPRRKREILVTIPLPSERRKGKLPFVGWADEMARCCGLSHPDRNFSFLYEAALRSLILHSPDDVYPGPYTYKRFWFRDAAFIINALLCAGLTERALRALHRFPGRQKMSGYFHSQEGEWDSNGEALWIMGRFCDMTGHPPPESWRRSILRAARWIEEKRLPAEPPSFHAGLLPPGFSAEHLGPNDYYYWDDLWSIAGLEAAARLLETAGGGGEAARCRDQARSLRSAVDESLAGAAHRLGRSAMPAAPSRRLDAGAIGSLAAGYPLQLFPPRDPRLLDTVEFILDRCMVAGGFFQDMIHSGVNAYLTLHLAQVLLRAGDARFLDLTAATAALASTTGQWPEAVHPRTRGGCMGDGQHIWAAAEWIVMMRNCFLREEGDRLLLGQGLPANWLQAGQRLAFGPAPTAFGTINLAVDCLSDEIALSWETSWHTPPAGIDIVLPGLLPMTVPAEARTVTCPRGEGP